MVLVQIPVCYCVVKMDWTKPLHGVSFAKLTLFGAIAQAHRWVGEGSGGIVPFVNVHVLMEAHSDASYLALLQNSRMVLADGMPVVWLSHCLRDALPERVSGPDFMRSAIEQRKDLRVACVGSTPEVLTKLSAIYPGLLFYSPPFRPVSAASVVEDWAQVMEQSQGLAPHWVFVGLGAPKQEYWMAEAAKLAPGTLFFGVGAAFDFIAGAKNRAPAWMRKSGLEWMFRLLSEPRRLFRRYLITNTKFLGLSLVLCLKRRENESTK